MEEKQHLAAFVEAEAVQSYAGQLKF